MSYWWLETTLGERKCILETGQILQTGAFPRKELLTRSFRAPIIQGWLAAHEWKPVNQLGCWSNSQSKGKSGPSSWIASTLLRGWHFTYWTGQNGISIFAGWQFTTDDRQALAEDQERAHILPTNTLEFLEMRKPTVGESFKTAHGWDTRAQVSHFTKTLRKVSRR